MKILLYYILRLLHRLPFRDKFGCSISDNLKSWWYWNLNHKKYCLCGGRFKKYGWEYYDMYEVICDKCSFIADED
jgi:hypothetical protein